MLLRVDERTVREKRLPVVHADGRRGLGRLQRLAVDDPGRLPDGQVLLDDLLPLVLSGSRSNLPSRRPGSSGEVFQSSSLGTWWLVATTNVNVATGQPFPLACRSFVAVPAKWLTWHP